LTNITASSTANETAGVLPTERICDLIAADHISLAAAAPGDRQLQPASMDLTPSKRAWRVRASFLPSTRRRVEDCLTPDLLMQEINLERGAVFERDCVYLVELGEQLNLPPMVEGSANPKSSTGRIDVFTRLVTDGGAAFDDVLSGYSGPLYLEISPRTFSVLARKGDRLSQLRIRRGPHTPLKETVFSIDLRASGEGPVGWRARRHAGVIDLQRIGRHAVSDFWEPVYPHKGRLVLHPEDFYILASKEHVRVPATQAAEMAPIAPELGEFRAHYAGFFDPGFGGNEGGSRAVLEVRTRDVPFILEDGQPVGKLVYEPMTAKPRALYGSAGSHYQGQGLRLSKHFART